MGRHFKSYHLLLFLLTGIVLGYYASELIKNHGDLFKTFGGIYAPILSEKYTPRPVSHFIPLQNTNFATIKQSRGTTIPTTFPNHRQKPIPTLLIRSEISFILEREKKSIGAELGVLFGDFSRNILKNWPSCKEYHLVDLWKSQGNYVDLANVNNTEQEEIFQTAKKNLKPWLK
eukprot:Tbor_TRINITY_DN5644_c0_g1::TRINITY_DN5644_c0_g1_i3::g.8349::m.8349